MLVLDSGGVSRLARRRQDSAALIAVFRRDGLWPPVVPSVVLAESITGRRRSDANISRFLKTCDIIEELPERLARRAGALRALARQGSAVDAIVVALAEPGGAVLTSDLKDLRALATHADAVRIYRA
ncbi:MAG: twitching motility protein PilT [Actinomycetia bacterium]|nr:twitching motility protein PilT [Actinomycetes bacterium]MCP4083778.1 twitching motility protein PilT [Actinomycetes bacterium]